MTEFRVNVGHGTWFTNRVMASIIFRPPLTSLAVWTQSLAELYENSPPDGFKPQCPDNRFY